MCHDEKYTFLAPRIGFLRYFASAGKHSGLERKNQRKNKVNILYIRGTPIYKLIYRVYL